MAITENTEDTLRKFILQEFLPGEDPQELTDTTPLITGGVLDSIGTLKLALFIEERFGVTLQAHETDPDYIDSIAAITNLIRTKKG
ncbi:MAG TPA: acyl carrier protein [Burkholderiales bacterium]